MDYLNAFLCGGILCDIGQILIDKTPLTPARILTGYVVAGVVLSALGWYAPLAELAGCILRDAKRVLPVSVLLDGEYGQRGVHCGVPCRIGKNGIEEIVQLDLNDEEQRMLDASCQVIRKHIAMAAAL